MYKSLARPVLFGLDAEIAHKATINALRWYDWVPANKLVLRSMYDFKHKDLHTHVFGIDFPNPVGLAAGLDKDAEAYEMFGAMGFGFVEIGTITPKAQPGNDLPRLFRLPADKALINRMGFNNMGVDKAVKMLEKRSDKIIIGGNIGKNKVTPNEKATDDYIYCFERLFDHVDYFVVNVSSPNTPNLRELQDKKPLLLLLETLQNLNQKQAHPKPILLKIAPDLTTSQIDDVIDIVPQSGIAGLVATNTTISRAGLSYPQTHIDTIGAGGLSGAPLTNRSTEIIQYIHQHSSGKIPIIGVGGIMTPENAIEKLEAGASLVQVYSGFIYEGPAFVKKINKSILKYRKKN